MKKINSFKKFKKSGYKSGFWSKVVFLVGMCVESDAKNHYEAAVT